MNFDIIDIPEDETGEAGTIRAAMVANLGKAISIPLNGKNADSFRKTLRASLNNKKILDKFLFRTKVNPELGVMVVWLEAKDEEAEVSTSIIDSEGIKA